MSLLEPLTVRADNPVVLIVDDRADAARVRECLTDAGLDGKAVVWTRTVDAGIATASRSSRCILLDLGLPDADGLTALQSVVEALPDVPVIVLTGRDDPTGVEALAAGAQDYLVKEDITAELLGRAIRYAMERKRAQRTGRRLREARLSSSEKARLERGLLPTPLLFSDVIDCATYYQPGRDHAVLGGDFFDVVETPDGKVRAVIGDVMGHGPDEAALGVHLRVAWRTLVLAGASDDRILPTLATLLKAESGTEPTFVTVCDLTIDTDLVAHLRVAGHPAPLLCARGSTRYLDVAVGTPLGIEARGDGGWPETTVPVGGGSSMVLYTDGLLDAYAGENTLGIDEITEAVSRVALKVSGPPTWIPALIGDAPRESIDDTAVVVLTTRPPSDE